MKRFLLVSLFGLLFGSVAYAQEDCLDEFGDLIEDCTCTNVAGDIISCTDGTILFPVGGGDDDDDDGETQPPGPGNDGIDNDGDGQIDEPDEMFWDGTRLGARVGVIVRPESKPIDMVPNFNPFILNVKSPPIVFDLHLQIMWSGDSKPIDPNKVTITVRRTSYPEKILVKDIEYAVRKVETNGNRIKATIELFEKPRFATYEITTKYDQRFDATHSLFMLKEVSSSPFAIGSGPPVRNLLYRRLLDP